MKYCIIGSGGREHALCSSLKNSNNISNIYCIPGNAGTSLIAENKSIDFKDFKQIKDFYDEEKKQMEEAKQGGSQTLVGTDGKVKSPEFLKGVKPKTSYNTGASKN